jgi:VWFA-related protein
MRIRTSDGRTARAPQMRHTGSTVVSPARTGRWLWLLAFLGVLSLAAQDVIFRAGVSLVRVDAQVTGAAGGINGLRKEDFEIRDNGEPQRVLYCSQDEQPLDILLLFDNSGSMEPAIRRLAASAHTALSELRQGDRVAVANFNAEAWLIGGFNDNLAEVEATVGRVVDLHFGGGTHILAAVDQAAKYFAQKADPQRRHAILIFTDDDGQPSASEKSVVNHMWEHDVLLCGLIIPTPMSQRPGGASLGRGNEDMLGVAAKTGGETVDADDPGHTFREMLRRIRRRYSIYYAMPSGKPGASRRVAVDLSPQGRIRYADAQVLARKGYVIPKSSPPLP